MLSCNCVNLSTDKVANKLQCYLVVNPIKKNMRPGSCTVPIRNVNGIHADVIDDIIANY